MANYKYECPKCGLEYDLNKRVTVSKRTCNHCGCPITTDEIDRQEEIRLEGEEAFRRRLELEEAAKRRRTTLLQAGCGCLLVGGVGALLIIGALNRKPTETSQQEIARKPEVEQNKETNKTNHEHETRKGRPQDKRIEPLPKKQTMPEIEVPATKDKLPSTNIEPIQPKIDAKQEEAKKQLLADNDAKFRLSAVKTLILDRKPDVALRFAKDLIRLHPDSSQAKEAQAIIIELTKKD